MVNPVAARGYDPIDRPERRSGKGYCSMSKVKDSRQKFITIYVRRFRHYRTKKFVYPKPPKKFLKLKIRYDRWKAYQERKRPNPPTNPPNPPAAA